MTGSDLPYRAQHVMTHQNYLYLVHTTHPGNLQRWLPQPAPYRPDHSDARLCRVMMAWFHGVTDSDGLMAAHRGS